MTRVAVKRQRLESTLSPRRSAPRELRHRFDRMAALLGVPSPKATSDTRCQVGARDWRRTEAGFARASQGGLAAFERDLMRARTTEGRAHIATRGQGPQCLSKRTRVPALSTAGARQLQNFGLGVSSAPLRQCRRLHHAAFPQNTLGTASVTGIFPAARTCEFSTRSLDNRAQSNPLKIRFNSALARDWSQGAWPKTRDICPCGEVACKRRSRDEYAIAKTIHPRGNSFSSGWISSIPRLPNPRCVRPIRSVSFRQFHVRAARENEGT